MNQGHVMPRFDDRWSYLYLEKGRIEQDAHSLTFLSEEGITHIPINQVGLLMLGPGTSVTHQAMKSLANNNSLVCWCGGGGSGFYGHASVGARSSRRLLRQAQLFCDEESRVLVIRRMYAKRFSEPFPENATLDQIRGMEGARVRAGYKRMSEKYHVHWEKRNYDPGNWDYADPVNRALSSANALLYGLCHAAILAAGYSPAIGFIHTGKMLSFVYDMADLYKTETTIPAAFEAAQSTAPCIEKRTRFICNEFFKSNHIMEKILPDIAEVLYAGDDTAENADEFEGRIITLDGRAQPGRLPWESERESTG